MGKHRRPDHWSRRAAERDYPARSVFKLEEIDRRLGLLGSGDRVLDLGCSPGSWLKYASERVGEAGVVVGVDLVPPRIPLPGNARFLRADVLEVSAREIGATTFDVVLSDMAPSTSGDALVDQERSWELLGGAMRIALAVLVPGGRFAGKLFFSPRHVEAVATLEPRFQAVRTIRPRATRAASREVFVVGLGFRP